jgi:hypothetical protein
MTTEAITPLRQRMNRGYEGAQAVRGNYKLIAVSKRAALTQFRLHQVLGAFFKSCAHIKSAALASLCEKATLRDRHHIFWRVSALIYLYRDSMRDFHPPIEGTLT